MAETDLWFGTLSATVRVEDLPASRQVVAIELPANGEWRVCGAGTSNADGIAMLPITGMPTSRIYAVAIDDWGRPFVPGMAVAFGDVIRPTQFLGWMYQVTSPGVLPGEEPEWWNSMAGVPQPVGTAMMQAVRHYQPIAHGPVSDIEWEDGLPWTPAALAVPPRIWLDGQSPVTEVDGAVSSWNDQSGNGYHFIQTDAAARPVAVNTLPNGTRAVSFDGVDDRLVHAGDGSNVFQDAVSGWALTIYKKRSSATPAGSACVFYSNASASASHTNRFNVIASRAATPGYGAFASRRQTTDATAIVGRSESDVGKWVMRLDIADWSNGDVFLWANGKLDAYDLTTMTSGNTSGGAGPGLILGAGGTVAGVSADSNSDVDIACLIVGAGSLPSEDEAAKLFGWAAHRFGLTDNLPDDHPYKSEPPKITG